MNCYMFKKGKVLNTLDLFKPKGGMKYTKLVSIDFNTKDLRAHPSQVAFTRVTNEPKTDS